MTVLTDRVIGDELRVYGVSATSAVRAAIRAYIPLLLHWNRRISLTTVTDPLEILRFHFGESMFAASVLSGQNSRLADVGSGAGFPGLPLKIMLPTLDLVLIESNAKKATFLAEAVRELGMENVGVYRGRFEAFNAENSAFDVITSRAMGMHDQLAKWAWGAVNSGGSLILWLAKHDATQVAMQDSWQWREPVLIPGSRRRTLLLGVRT